MSIGKNMRLPAVPLITVDPYFSIWSFNDNLNDDFTRHWTGRANPMLAGVIIDGKFWCAMGNARSQSTMTGRECQKLKQTELTVTPIKTIYVMENDMVRVTLTFLTPLLLDRLDIMTRPVSYINYNVDIIDGKEHDVKFIFAISAECCVDSGEQKIVFKRNNNSVCVGNAEQKVLSKSGDGVGIDWGYLHVADTSGKLVNGIWVNCRESLIYRELDENGTYNAFDMNPYILLEKTESSGVITLAYDELKPIEYFGEQLDEYYKKYFTELSDMLDAAVSEYDKISALCDRFDEKLMAEAKKFGEKYAYAVAAAYRQAIAAHKLVEDRDGNILFMSKECLSDGCIATLDVTYPSMPLFLKYAPELVHGMLRPIIKYAKSSEWKYDFAPHDVGIYPLANGQCYGDNSMEYQMPIEECGNMLICVAACAKATGNTSFAEENKEILKLWADYLISKGYNPENQLCTDDFAGHMAQNCNLSLKAIIGIAAYGQLFGDEYYIGAAREMAEQWKKEAVCEYGSKLAFDRDNTWSMKYNIVWDKLLDLGLFEDEIYEKEIRLYSEKMNRYGVPLDNRETYTKIDWLMWTTVMTDDREYFEKVTETVYNMLTETTDRVPMTDWYDTLTGKQCSFQNRSVLGGIFIPIMK